MRRRCQDRDGHRRLHSLLAHPIVERHTEPFSLPETAPAEVNDFFCLMVHFLVKLHSRKDESELFFIRLACRKEASYKNEDITYRVFIVHLLLV